MKSNCVCGARIIRPVGSTSSKIMIIGDLPDYEDMKSGQCLTGKSSVILRSELARVGISLNSLLYSNFWLHYRSKECTPDNQMNNLAELLNGKTHILLLGSEPTKYLFGESAIDISGVELKHKIYTKTRFMSSISLSVVSNDDLGELRIALERFSNMLKEKK